MKTDKDLIIQLIQADLKHNQLINGLESLDLHTESYFLGLHKTVAQLMGLGTELPDQWLALYNRYLEEAHKQPISNEPDNLLPQAEECYRLLQACMSIENCLNEGIASKGC